MRFSHFLKYNAVPEWQNHYMDYNALKNLIYTLQTDELKQQDTTIDDANEDGDQKSYFTRKLKSNFFKKGNGNSNSSRKSSSKSVNNIIEINNKTKNAGQHDDGNDNDEAGKVGISALDNADFVQEETFELDDYKNLSSSNKNSKKSGNSLQKPTNLIRNASFKKVKGKFWEHSRRSSSASDSESKTLSNTYDTFVSNLSTEKFKVDDFYKRLEAKFYEKYETLIKDFEKQGIYITTGDDFQNPDISDLNSEFTTGSLGKQQIPVSVVLSENLQNSNNSTINNDMFSDEDFDEEDEDFESKDNTALLHYSQFNVKSQKKSLLKQSVINLYIDLSQLKSFIELNKMGFSKITKKADKVLHLNTREELIQSEEFFTDTYTFLSETINELNFKITQLITLLAKLMGNPFRMDEYKKELKQYLHDHIVWERSNTWKDMLGIDSYVNEEELAREAEAKKKADREHLYLDCYSYPLPFQIHTKKPKIDIENLLIPKLFFTKKAFKIAFIFVVTAILLGIKTFNDPVEHRCMALVECVAFLWASVALPLWVTAMLVPLLTVLFRVLKNDDGTVMTAVDASSTILASMWSSTIMILLAGFTLSAALARYEVAKVLASWLLAFAGEKPRNVLLMAMAVVFFLSMWISNVASPVLTYSLMSPILDPLLADDPFAKSLVLGVALAANVGGLSSPISSPQNIISMEYLTPYNIGWGQFFAVALPVGIITLLLFWGLMCLTFDLSKTKIEKFVPIKTAFTMKQYFVVAVTLATILLWCVESEIESAFGSSGQIAVLPIAIFFGSGLLGLQDLQAFPWSIVILAMGGIALGKGVQSSGLLATIANALQRRIDHDSAEAVLCIFGILMLVVGTFVSHTVSAIIIVPLVQQVGNKLSEAKAAPILVFGCTLLASGGMGLASSGFPNITAISKLDRNGDPYLSMLTFISRGVPASLIVFVVVITVGYGIMSSILKPVVS
ncbi:hypothetical protein TPHA_0B03530 [Tetrapisispora phaffii CBS 4417]|uniref:SPX domain-containing protein n=1 Tax=Tetrapisispora phaffii (strain ATCC 24235 / CBS 4417 / NBRC 1672 / NRRL Y-8282 / UCD 70-5) TaxID=1071381 RepID=G8BPU2_TETPH|nr:hypothetical protein TPHA_0B03530 [Tetrapisispora phaffii CBS 4417]CCE62023.1 hypothetical protein TPHA_0B03530 [Tetrapisispora phaffii CBS 4417]